MNKLFFPKLAAQNIKKNSKIYFPYIITSAISASMVYIISSMTSVKWISHGAINSIMVMGTIVAAIFFAIFLFYTNSFLVKRRKKEFGLFNILGMEKKHIGKVMFFESLYVFLISVVAGVPSGMLFGNLIFKLMVKALKINAQTEYGISMTAALGSVIFMFAVFIINLLHNVLSVRLSNAVELLRGGKTGEKEPKSNIIVAILGVLSLAAGYIMALKVKSPLSAITIFFVAVILVMIGTYCLFSSGSIWIMKALKRNKAYYYKTNHFISVSSMMYRMKQNAAGLANICILSTAILVVISTTVSLNIGIEDVMRTRYPRNILMELTHVKSDEVPQYKRDISEFIVSKGVETENVCSYRSAEVASVQLGNRFQKGNADSDTEAYTTQYACLILMPVSDYNETNNKNITLNSDEVLLYAEKGEISGDIVNLAQTEYKIKERVEKPLIIDGFSANMMNYYYFVVSDESVVENMYSYYNLSLNSNAIKFRYGFDTDADDEIQKSLAADLSDRFEDSVVYSVSANKEDAYSLYGGLLFLGIFLGIVFIMATVLIMYYKQIYEGYDDKERFHIMQNVGMSKQEVKKTIHSQVLSVFFLPLIMAVVHICFGFSVIGKLLALLNLSNTVLFLICTVGTIIVFAIFYAIVYALTAKTYYKIVEGK